MTTIVGGSIFSVHSFGGAPFYMRMGECMSKDISKKVIDIIDVELIPGEPKVCLGNGEQGFECCCDECDYFLLCFPQFDTKNKEKD